MQYDVDEEVSGLWRMFHLWIKCICGTERDVPAPVDVVTMTRAEILLKARRSRCRTRNAVDMRRYWNPGANALEGAEEIGDGPPEW